MIRLQCNQSAWKDSIRKVLVVTLDVMDSHPRFLLFHLIPLNFFPSLPCLPSLLSLVPRTTREGFRPDWTVGQLAQYERGREIKNGGGGGVC